MASREQAREAVAAGRVLVSGSVADKPARLVAADDPVEMVGPGARFVGRGGEKLDAALEHFALDVRGARALDAGASTGGFTDALLQRGAAEVVAVDVGYGQLHERLRADPRVTVRERTNVRELTAAAVSGPFDVIVADLSFISLVTVAPVLTGELAGPEADLIVLVKPQFEVGRRVASRGRGVVRDPAEWAGSIERVAAAMVRGGADIIDGMVSPLRGADGNVEFLLHGRAHRAHPVNRVDAAALAAAAGAD